MKARDYFLTICLNPVLQKTLVLPHLHEDRVNRCREYYFDVAGKGIFVSKVLMQLGEKTVHLTQAGGRFKMPFLKEKISRISLKQDLNVQGGMP